MVENLILESLLEVELGEAKVDQLPIIQGKIKTPHFHETVHQEDLQVETQILEAKEEISRNSF